MVEAAQIPESIERLSAERQKNLVINISSQQSVDYDTVFKVLQAVNGSKASGVTFSIYE